MVGPEQGGQQVDDIDRTKAGKWEKASHIASITFLFPTLVGSTLLEEAGVESFWLRMALVLFLGVLGLALLSRPALREAKSRLAADLENGVFDCAIRFASATPGSLDDLWNAGAAQVTPGGLAFQPQQGTHTPQPTGRTRTFARPVVLGKAEMTGKKAPGWGRSWTIRELQTDNGRIHVAAGPAGLALMENSFRNPAP